MMRTEVPQDHDDNDDDEDNIDNDRQNPLSMLIMMIMKTMMIRDEITLIGYYLNKIPCKVVSKDREFQTTKRPKKKICKGRVKKKIQNVNFFEKGGCGNALCK